MDIDRAAASGASRRGARGWYRRTAVPLGLVMALLAPLTAMVATATPSSAATCPCTIFPASATPATPDVNDPGPVEVGLKFTSDIAGAVTAIRFYKGAPDNSGPHPVHLWASDGTLLASATSGAETNSGWQQVAIPPVQISAGAIYVASYFAPAGHYSASSFGFTTSVDNPPLHGLANGGIAGGNGVFNYTGPPGGFPSSSFNATNYWVDVAFQNTNPVTITTSTLPGGTVGSSYPATSVAASGGIPPYTFSVTAGSVPAGLSLSPAGQITGTPTGPAGTFSFTVKATDNETPPLTANKPLSITIAKETTTLKASPGQAQSGLFSTTVTVSATLTGGPSNTPLAGQTVTFTLNNNDQTPICKAVTKSSGVATCSGEIGGGLLALLFGSPDYTATFAGNPSLTSSTATASIDTGLL